jgi:Tfp pilus assembly protein PilF
VDRTSLNCIQEYAEFLAKYKNDLPKAQELFIESVRLAPENPITYHNYGLFLVKYMKYYTFLFGN